MKQTRGGCERLTPLTSESFIYHSHQTVRRQEKERHERSNRSQDNVGKKSDSKKTQSLQL